MIKKSLLDAMKERRSFYAIGKESILPDEKIIELVEQAVKHVPSAFNSQSSRVLVLLGKEHDRLWDITKEILKGIVPPANFESTKTKLNSFKNGYGTVLFFEDQDTVKGLQKQFPLYEQNFPVWSLESSGMLQYGVWMLLEEAGFGASLQHYNPLIDKKVKSAWNIPEQWLLLSQMPFGKPLANPDEKTFISLNDRIKISK